MPLPHTPARQSPHPLAPILWSGNNPKLSALTAGPKGPGPALKLTSIHAVRRWNGLQVLTLTAEPKGQGSPSSRQSSMTTLNTTGYIQQAKRDRRNATGEMRQAKCNRQNATGETRQAKRDRQKVSRCRVAELYPMRAECKPNCPMSCQYVPNACPTGANRCPMRVQCVPNLRPMRTQ
eukprot:4193955-Karenia_brevis.AAC.1